MNPRVVIPLILLVLLGQSIAAEVQDELRDGREAIRSLIENGEFAQAETLTRDLLGSIDPRLELETARTLDLLVQCLLFSGREGEVETRAAAERALRLKEKHLGVHDTEVAASLTNLGRLFTKVHETEEAETALRRAIAIREAAPTTDELRLADSITALADLKLQTGDFPEANRLYERALAIKEEALGPTHPELAGPLYNLAVQLRRTTEYDRSEALFGRALSVAEAAHGPDHIFVAWVLNGYGILLDWKGEYEQAQEAYELAIAIADAKLPPEHPFRAACRNNLAVVLRARGDFAEALVVYRDVLRQREAARGADHPDVAQSLNNLAELLADMGDTERAREHLERALEIKKAAFGPDHPRTIATRLYLADLLREIGETDGARRLYEQSLVGLQNVDGAALDEGQALRGLASLDRLAGRYAGARRRFTEAAEVLEDALGPGHADVVAVKIDLATLAAKTGNLVHAAEQYDRARKDQEAALGSSHPTYARTLRDNANILFLLDKNDEALDLAVESSSVSRRHFRSASRALTEREALQYLSLDRSSLSLALSLLAMANDALRVQQVYDAVIQSRALVLDELAVRLNLLQGRSDTETRKLIGDWSAASTRLANLVVKGPSHDHPDVYRRMLQEAERDKELTEERLAARSLQFRAKIDSSAINLDQLRLALPPASGLVSFVHYRRAEVRIKEDAASESQPPELTSRPSYLALVLKYGETSPEIVALGQEAHLNNLIADWRRLASRPPGPDPDQQREAEEVYMAAGARLREALWDPVARVLGDVSRVFVVLDADLHLVNLSALPASKSRFLIEEDPLIHYLSTERDLVTGAPTARPGQGLLAIGGPAYDEPLKPENSRDTPSPASFFRGQGPDCTASKLGWFTSLPGTIGETDEVVRYWRQVNPPAAGTATAFSGHAGTRALHLIEAAATEAAVRSHASGREVLHFATHGFFLGDEECKKGSGDSTRGIGTLSPAPDEPDLSLADLNPLVRSGLVLAGANSRDQTMSGENDGILTALEIATLDLRGVKWAVLSACDTALGEVRIGEGVLGLQRAFRIAGVQTIIMSLWSVGDDATRMWMEELYRARYRANRSTAEAVREAGRRVLSQARDAGLSTHPFFWAAFVGAGEWR